MFYTEGLVDFALEKSFIPKLPFFIYCTKNLFRNMDIHQTAKIKILQKITKSSTVFTNMMLHS